MSKSLIERLALNAKLGDGTIRKQNNAYSMAFTSTSLDYLMYKRSICSEYTPTKLRTQKSGYLGKKIIYVFSVRHTQEAKICYELSNGEAIETIDSVDLAMWILDCGSVHTRHGTLHLYCNSLSSDETLGLIDKVYDLYPIKVSKLCFDKKQDGRSFPYIYIPRITAEAIQVDIENFLNLNDIMSLKYKCTRKYTLNDHRKAGIGRPPDVGPCTFREQPPELSRVGSEDPKQEDHASA